LNVIPSARRSASSVAVAWSGYGKNRQPPTAGPRAVEWTATIGKKDALEHPILKLLTRPNEEEGRRAFIGKCPPGATAPIFSIMTLLNTYRSLVLVLLC
jgi:hypothetical protein